MNRHRAFWALLSICAFFALGAENDGCSTEEGGGGGNDAEKEEKSGGGGSVKTNGNCGTTATDDCTPHVGPKGMVRVDALRWKITGAQKAASLDRVGLDEKAEGMFIVVKLRVTSDKNELATITDETIQLEAPNGNTYKADSDATVAAIGQGRDPLFLRDIRPKATLRSKVVFDVPKSLANRKLEVRFGAGSTHGYIRLPTRRSRVAEQAPPAADFPSYRRRYRGRIPRP